MCLTSLTRERSEHLVEVVLIQSPKHTPIHSHNYGEETCDHHVVSSCCLRMAIDVVYLFPSIPLSSPV